MAIKRFKTTQVNVQGVMGMVLWTCGTVLFDGKRCTMLLQRANRLQLKLQTVSSTVVVESTCQASGFQKSHKRKLNEEALSACNSFSCDVPAFLHRVRLDFRTT